MDSIAVFRSWDVASGEDLTRWLREHGHPGAQPGNHISARAQEHMLQQACGVDARVALLEAVFVVIAVHMGRQDVHATPTINSTPDRPRDGGQSQIDWSQMDHCQLEEMFLTRVPVLRSCPHFLRGRLRESFGMALRERFRAKLHGDREGEVRAWKLFAMTPIMLLHKPTGVGSVGRSELLHRADKFARGCWQELIHHARQSTAARPAAREFPEEEDRQRRGKAAQSRVQQGQVSRARQELTGASLAPRNSATLDELRSKRPQARQAEIPFAVSQYEPTRGLKFDAKLFASCLRSAPLGSSPGPGGCSYEILRVCLDDQECLLLLTDAAQDFARVQSRTRFSVLSCWPP